MSWSKNLQHEKLKVEQVYTTQYQEKVQTKTTTQKP